MKNAVLRNLNGKRIGVLFLLTNIVYGIMLVITIPAVMNHAGGMKLLDMMPAGYSPDYVNALMSALGTNGREAYLMTQIPLDLVYPFLFGVTYCLLFAFIIRKLAKQDSILFYLCFAPILAGFFDYLENIGIVVILKSYPDNSALWSQLTSICSVLKSSLTTIYFVALLVALVILLVKYIQSRSNKPLAG